MFITRKRRMIATIAAGITAVGLVIGVATSASAHDNGGQGRGGGPFGALVQAGTISSSQAQAVKEALRAEHDQNRQAREQDRQALRDQVLSRLVTAGTITQAQADAVASLDRGGIRELLTSGTVTRSQLREVHDAMRAAMESAREDHQAEKAASLKTVLADLVSDGTITQAQSDAISAAIAAAPRPADKTRR